MPSNSQSPSPPADSLTKQQFAMGTDDRDIYMAKQGKGVEAESAESDASLNLEASEEEQPKTDSKSN